MGEVGNTKRVILAIPSAGGVSVLTGAHSSSDSH